MLSEFDRVITFSRGIMKHRGLQSFAGNCLSYSSKNYDGKVCIVGWGNKTNTAKARNIANRNGLPYFSLEDGFIRSVGLGVKGAPSCSFVIDDLGIYYDATKPSRLETILAEYDFEGDTKLQGITEQAIHLIKKFKISKYNVARDIRPADFADNPRKKILVVAQTAGDMSLQYGYGNQFSTKDIIDAAFNENPASDIYLKIHPDVIAGKKKSDLDLENLHPACRVLTTDINPISLLEIMDKVYTKTSQMGFEALLLGKECVCFGIPFYAGWGLTDDRIPCSRRNRKLTVNQVFAGAYILYSRYFNPYLDKASDIVETLYTIHKYREIELVNGSVLLLHGFPAWKRFCHLHFFKSSQKNSLIFCSSPERVETEAKIRKTTLLIWSKPEIQALQDVIARNNLQSYHVEDGFIRSVSLGSDLTTPYSLVVDSRGLYFDPSCESDLEHIYNTYDFNAHTGLLARARKIVEIIVEAKLSKYNCAPHGELNIDRQSYDKVILIPGQVADDASIRLGGFGMTNLSLLELVRKNNPAAYIIYKPHPDVIAGNRKGSLPANIVHKYCDQVISDISIDRCIHLADEVHTITSLCGFDALLRDRKVVTYGLPFYSGWGLTEDFHTCKRRKRTLSRDELVAGALVLYPRYIHPVTKEFCEIERVLHEITKEQARYTNSTLLRRKKELRNRVMATSRQFIARFKKTDEH